MNFPSLLPHHGCALFEWSNTREVINTVLAGSQCMAEQIRQWGAAHHLVIRFKPVTFNITAYIVPPSELHFHSTLLLREDMVNLVWV